MEKENMSIKERITRGICSAIVSFIIVFLSGMLYLEITNPSNITEILLTVIELSFLAALVLGIRESTCLKLKDILIRVFISLIFLTKLGFLALYAYLGVFNLQNLLIVYFPGIIVLISSIWGLNIFWWKRTICHKTIQRTNFNHKRILIIFFLLYALIMHIVLIYADDYSDFINNHIGFYTCILPILLLSFLIVKTINRIFLFKKDKEK